MSDDEKQGTPKDRHYAKLRRARRDRKGVRREKFDPAAVPDGLVRLYGLHTIEAALANPKREIVSLKVTANALRRLGHDSIGDLPCPSELVEPRELDKLVGTDAVHQGVVADAKPLKPRSLSELGDAPLLLVLDQVTDPHNVGAIMRSAVAFGVGALITTSRHSPTESGVLAKAASGALEHIDHIEVRNLAEALGELADAGFQTVGLDSEGPLELEGTLSGGRIALVLGAEGKGLRQKTRETVAALARLDMPGEIKSLNVSNAAAISLYVAERFLKARA